MDHDVEVAQREAIKLYEDLVTNQSQATLLWLHSFLTRWKFGHQRTGTNVIAEEKRISNFPAPFMPRQH